MGSFNQRLSRASIPNKGYIDNEKNLISEIESFVDFILICIFSKTTNFTEKKTGIYRII